MSRKIILIKQELLLLVYELNRSGLLAENEKIRPILAQLEKLLLCDLSPSTKDRKSGSAGMPRPISYAVFCLKKKNLITNLTCERQLASSSQRFSDTVDGTPNPLPVSPKALITRLYTDLRSVTG